MISIPKSFYPLLFCNAVVVLLIIMIWYTENKTEIKEADIKTVIETDVGTVIGIDLGTTYSCVGVFKDGRVEIIANDQGNRITPSYVAFTAEGERLIGDLAKNQLTTNPENTIFYTKRLIGRDWSDNSVQSDIKSLPFKVVEESSKPHIEVKTGIGLMTFTPEEISAMVLTKLKEMAESYLGEKVTHAVVTVPAYFNDAQRQATKDAGAIAGLNIMGIINEPTAAAIAYGLHKMEGERNVLVFDFGGGTIDASLLTIDNGVFEVNSTNGNTHLGGEDINKRVMEHFLELYENKTGNDVRKDNKAVQKLRLEVEKAKRTLSFAHRALIEIEYFFDGKDFSETLTRAKFEDLNMDLFQSTMETVREVLKEAKWKKKDVDEYVLVGGSTRIPKIQQLIKEFFDGKEPSRGINTEEAVAYGAAIQAGVLSNKQGTSGIVVLDVNSWTVGIANINWRESVVSGGLMSRFILRNTRLPLKREINFSTVKNKKHNVTIEVYEGEHAMLKDNPLVGEFDLIGIRIYPKGVTQIIVTFKIDTNGILEVSAEEMHRGTKITITNDDRHTPDIIERMVKVAGKLAYHDREIKEKMEARNELERYAYSLKYQIGDKEKLGANVSDEDKKKIKQTINETLKWLEGNKNSDSSEYKKQKNDLEEILQPIIAKLHLGKVPPHTNENYEL